MYANCIRINYRYSKEGKGLKKIIDNWHDILYLRYTDPKAILSKNDIAKYNRLLYISNIAVANIQWKESSTVEKNKLFIACSAFTQKKAKAGYQRFIIPSIDKYLVHKINLRLKLRINKKSKFKFYKSKEIKLPYKNKKIWPFKFNYIRVNSLRSISSIYNDRGNDSETVILENIAKFISYNNLENHSIKIFIFTYLEPCLACDNIIIEFLHQFPNIEMELYYQKPYNKIFP